LKLVKLRGLRVYTNPVGLSSPSEWVVFYSRRADGPYYRWLYEAEVGQWRAAHVQLSVVTLRVLCVAHWQALPVALQAKLIEHYLE